MAENSQGVLSVSQFNDLVKQVLRAGFPGAVWICGELQGFDRSRHKRHVFFDLCEKDPDTRDITARIGAVIFQNRRPVIEKILHDSGDPFELKDGLEVKFLCRVDFYGPHGALRLVVEKIDPVHTLGRIAQEKQRLVAQLKQEGLLEKNKACSLSQLPLRIGLITSVGSAAYNDFLEELRSAEISFQVFVHNALMQGRGAEAGVCRALGALRDIDGLDAVVITRGGGSIADLGCFDSRCIAEAIAQYPLPVLSGIGHEIDLTVTDLAAYTYQKTPTAIAALLVRRVLESRQAMDEVSELMARSARDFVIYRQERLKTAALEFRDLVRGFLTSHEHDVLRCAERLKYDPSRQLEQAGRDIGERGDYLVEQSREFLARRLREAGHVEDLIKVADPRRTLQRGFSLTRDNTGRLIRSVEDVSRGAELRTELADGQVISEVTDREERSSNG